MNYSDTVKAAYERCGGKSKPRFGDIKEFAGWLSMVLASDSSALNAFLKNGRRRAKKDGGNTELGRETQS